MRRVRRAARDVLRGWQRRLMALVRRRAADQTMSAELAFHLDMETEKNIRAGLNPAEARRVAMLAFGGVGRFTEEVRDVRSIGWLDDLSKDLRHAARGFRRSPGFTLAVIAALSLGIGANTAVFSVVYGVVLAPLPYAEPHRLVRLWERNPAQQIEHGTVSPGTFIDLRERSRSLDGIALFGERVFLLSDGDESWESPAATVTPGLFDLLGVRPAAGRTFPPEERGSEWSGSFDEVVISHALWQRRFGGAPDVVGRALRMDGWWTYTIVGVMPPGFAFPPRTELWVPLSYSRAVSATERQYRYHSALGRLRAGITVEQAGAEAAGIAMQLAAEYPASNAGWTVRLERLDRSLVGGARRTLLVLLGLAGCVLLIACGNVATLAVARAAARTHETAVRIALGAGTRRLVRQWSAEGLLLAALGGAGGLAVGYWSSRLLLALAPADIPRLEEVAFGWPVVTFALLLTLAAAFAVSLAPALRTRALHLTDALRSRAANAGHHGTPGAASREWLVGAQVALTLVLTVAAALLGRSFDRMRGTDLGFRKHDVLSAELRVPGGRFPAPTAHEAWFQRLQYYDRLLAELSRLPGMRSVAATTDIPLGTEMGAGSLWRADAPGAHGGQPPTSAADQWKAAIQIVTPRYFETMGIPLLRGRAFQDDDRFTLQQFLAPDGARPPGVAIIDEAMARRFWPDGDALGATVVLFDDRSFASSRTIVGVVRGVRAESVTAEAAPTIFLPFGQHTGRSLSLVLATSLPPGPLVGPVTDHLRRFDPSIGISRVRPLDAVVGRALSRPRFTMLLVGSFATLALAIAGVGVFGIVGFLVTRRSHEIGIRMALGARPGAVLWLVLSEGLRPVMLGLIVGTLAAVGAARAMQALLYGIAPLDSVSFAGATLLLLVASVAAAVVPARRAVGVDPLRSLRGD